MKLRKILSIVLVILGLGLFLTSTYAKQRIMAVKKSVHQAPGLIPDNPFNVQIEKAINEKISSYDMPILLGMVGGVVFVVIGVGILIYGRRR